MRKEKTVDGSTAQKVATESAYQRALIMLHKAGRSVGRKTHMRKKTATQPKTLPSREASPGNAADDKALGLEQEITRRDFLNASLLASGSLLLTAGSPAQLLAQAARPAATSTPHASTSHVGMTDDWTGYGGVGDYANSNGNTTGVLQAGHQIRDGLFETLPASMIDTEESYDCVIVGGGISGLAAALTFQQQAGKGNP